MEKSEICIFNDSTCLKFKEHILQVSRIISNINSKYFKIVLNIETVYPFHLFFAV